MDFLSSILDSIGKIFSLASTPVAIIRGTIGIVLVFFLPGFAWTLVFFKQINIIERIALSVGLSIALVTLSILFLNLVAGMKITAVNSIGVILAIIIVPIIIYSLKRLLKRHNRSVGG